MGQTKDHWLIDFHHINLYIRKHYTSVFLNKFLFTSILWAPDGAVLALEEYFSLKFVIYMMIVAEVLALSYLFLRSRPNNSFGPSNTNVMSSILAGTFRHSPFTKYLNVHTQVTFHGGGVLFWNSHKISILMNSVGAEIVQWWNIFIIELDYVK